MKSCGITFSTFSDTIVKSKYIRAIKIFISALMIICIPLSRKTTLCSTFLSRPAPIGNGMQNYDYMPGVNRGILLHKVTFTTRIDRCYHFYYTKYAIVETKKTMHNVPSFSQIYPWTYFFWWCTCTCWETERQNNFTVVLMALT